MAGNNVALGLWHIGQHVRVVQMESLPDPVHDAWFEIIGVIGDIKNNGLQDPIDPEMWAPSTLGGAPTVSPDILLTQNPMILFEFLSSNRQNRYKRLTHCLPPN